MKTVNLTMEDKVSLQIIKEAKSVGLSARLNNDEISVDVSGSNKELIEFLEENDFYPTAENFPELFESVASKPFGQFLIENSTDDAKKSLDAILGFLKDQDSLDDSGKEMLKFAEGMLDFFKKNKGFSPAQASWIWKTSKALF